MFDRVLNTALKYEKYVRSKLKVLHKYAIDATLGSIFFLYEQLCSQWHIEIQ